MQASSAPGATGARLGKALPDPKAYKGGQAPHRYALPPDHAAHPSDKHPANSYGRGGPPTAQQWAGPTPHGLRQPLQHALTRVALPPSL